MRRLKAIVLFLALDLLSFGSIRAESTRVDVAGEDIKSSGRFLTITAVLPSGVVGKRIDRAVLEVPITLVESEDSAFNDFPLLELRENGTDGAKQTFLMEKGFVGIARFDVTRLVRGWNSTRTHAIVLGALAESNGTVFALGQAAQWSGGTKARLVVDYSMLGGESVRAISK